MQQGRWLRSILNGRTRQTNCFGRSTQHLPSDLVDKKPVSSLGRFSSTLRCRFTSSIVTGCFANRSVTRCERNYLWRVWPAVDEDALKQNASIFLGKHDFAAFGSPTTPKGTTVRTVTKAEWKKMPDGEWQFEVRADAFLYRMVRRLVFVQVAVAQGRCSVEKVQHALSKAGRTSRRAGSRARADTG